MVQHKLAGSADGMTQVGESADGLTQVGGGVQMV